ncbi:unnamed protein product [Adineta ricciae]|uniref:Uncharacterized protein n=1 Tax=Adineta ricciae TaxID=249248 RepID=A0A816D554_ADIRI|nr:unnamed protein product [Adineta ricciae]CAF1632642.1 unnamed protein product [Adineta ricciae]
MGDSNDDEISDNEQMCHSQHLSFTGNNASFRTNATNGASTPSNLSVPSVYTSPIQPLDAITDELRKMNGGIKTLNKEMKKQNNEMKKQNTRIDCSLFIQLMSLTGTIIIASVLLKRNN